MASTVLPNGIIIPEKYSRDWYADLYHNWQELDNLLGGGTPKDGTLTIQKNGTTVGTFSANQATDETINITVPDVNDATLTIQKNGTTVDTFTANSSTDKTVDITVPTKTSDLTNDSGFITSDDTKIPLAGSNAISGSLIPATDNSIDIGSSTNNIKMLYTKGIAINGTQFLPSDYIPRSGGEVSGNINFDSSWNYTNSNQGWFPSGFNYVNSTNNQRFGFFNIYDDSNRSFRFFLTDHSGAEKNILSFGIDSNNRPYITGYNNNAIAKYDDVVPRSGGAVVTGFEIGRTDNDNHISFCGGTGWGDGGTVSIYGSNVPGLGGCILLHPSDGTQEKYMWLNPNGTWTWDGTACQITSDQRLKQQITEIDDKLLDAWEDVDLVQFKYNDAVDAKKDKARLHTGYVVQQIDKACQSHGVDISAYGLYCHEEYPEETEEVEVEQADGTKVKERKVIREANEHYSLRYTEVYAVECMYLRRCIARLTARIEELEKGNKEVEK